MNSLRTLLIVFLLLVGGPLLDPVTPLVFGQFSDCDDSCRERTRWTQVVSSVPTTHLEYEFIDCFYCANGHCVITLGDPGGVCKIYYTPIRFRTWPSGSIKCNTVYVNGVHESVLSGTPSPWFTIATSYNCN